MGERTCSETGCDRPLCGRGLCRPHYQQAWKAGTLPPRTPREAAIPTVIHCRICGSTSTYLRTRGPVPSVCRTATCQEAAAAIRRRRWSAQNPEEDRAAKHRYDVANKDKAAAYYQANKPRITAQQKRWREENVSVKRAADRAWAQANKGRRLDAEYCRRARKREQGYERVYRKKVFNRDGWVCQLCGQPVDRQLAGRDPMRASLDHRLALSRGGSHTYDNVQLAHLICNMRKHANPVQG